MEPVQKCLLQRLLHIGYLLVGTSSLSRYLVQTYSCAHLPSDRFVTEKVWIGISFRVSLSHKMVTCCYLTLVCYPVANCS